MKLAIVSDTHLGYARFEEDALAQAEHALKDAGKNGDVIIVAGDVFDVKTPKLETIKRAAEIFSSLKKPVFIIHGNHERRSRDMVNPVELLSTLANVHYLHNQSEVFECNGEKVQITGFGSVPEEYAKIALRKVADETKAEEGVFRLLVMHQSIKELVYGSEEEVSLDDLHALKFDLIVNGHIHQYHSELGGKLLIPGSTVITQLRSDEQGERGYIVYDSEKRSHEFVNIPARLFFYSELKFENATIAEVKQAVEEKIAALRLEHEGCIVKIKLTGKLKEGLAAADLALECPEGVYIQNGINVESIAEKIKEMRKAHEEKASVREVALKKLGERLRGKVTLFEPGELFEKLCEGCEEGMEYLNNNGQRWNYEGHKEN